MIQLSNIKQIYFLGIGGIGMSALARYFVKNNYIVSGYDRVPSAMTNALQKLGIEIHFDEHIEALNKNAELVIYTPAIPKDNKELLYYQNNNYTVAKRSDVLQALTANSNAICVAGTHGKTTISSMIAHILTHSGFGCNAFLGGIAVNYNSNYIGAESKNTVVEADEYDRSFLKLKPNYTLISAMDPDHLDIYGTAEEMEKAYIEFANLSANYLLYKHGLSRATEFIQQNKESYSLQNDVADFYAQNIRTDNGSYHFEIYYKGKLVTKTTLNMGGMHNIENSIASFGIAYKLGIAVDKIAAAIASFKGVQRRFEYVVKNDQVVYIDDYAHHPEELKNLIRSAKNLFRNRKVRIVFQPHLFSRTRDFCQGFADSLSEADEVILMEIYPARELPIEGVNAQMIKDLMSHDVVTILSKDAVLEWVKLSKPDLLITAGAGDIDRLVEPIKNILNER